MIELAITIKDENHRFTDKEIIYKPITLAHEDPLLSQLVEQSLKKIAVEMNSPDIIIKANMVW